MNAAIITRRCCSTRRRRIRTYPATSRTPDSAFRVAFTAGRSWTVNLQLVQNHRYPDQRQIGEGCEKKRPRSAVGARGGEAKREPDECHAKRERNTAVEPAAQADDRRGERRRDEHRGEQSGLPSRASTVGLHDGKY